MAKSKIDPYNARLLLYCTKCKGQYKYYCTDQGDKTNHILEGNTVIFLLENIADEQGYKTKR